MKLKIYISFSLFLSSILPLAGQYASNRYPVRFSQYYSCYPLINPASAGSVADYEISFGNKRMLGNYAKTATYYFNANMRLRTRRNGGRTPFSTVGMLVYNDREGKYLNRSRLYFTYSWHSKITRSVFFSGGLHIGGMNYSVKGTALSGDGSDWKLDGSGGLRLYNDKFHAGVAVSQLMRSDIQPLEEVARLIPFFTTSGCYLFDVTENLQLSPAVNIRIHFEDEPNLVDCNLKISYKKKAGMILGVHNTDYVVSTVFIRKVFKEKNRFNFLFSYGFPYSPKEIRTHFAEAGISAALDK